MIVNECVDRENVNSCLVCLYMRNFGLCPIYMLVKSVSQMETGQAQL